MPFMRDKMVNVLTVVVELIISFMLLDSLLPLS